MTRSANLQSLTVKQAARLMNVSERSVYMARTIVRKRPDLALLIEAGTMSLNEAYRLVTGKKKDTPFERLVRAWNAASPLDRRQFLDFAVQRQP